MKPLTTNAINVSLTKSQIEFLELQCQFPGFFAGYGSGKSYIMGFKATQQIMRSSSVVVGIYEPDFGLIKSVAVPTMEMWLSEFGIVHRFNEHDKMIYTSNSGVGDVRLTSMENPEKIVGFQNCYSHADELDTLTMVKAKVVWTKIMGRNRQQPDDIADEYKIWSEQNQRMEVLNTISAYSTPEGFNFCYHMWKQQQNPRFQCVHGNTEDNPELSQDYIEGLKSTYTPELIEAYLHGQFVNMAAGTVYNNYNRKAHESYETIKHGEVLYIGCDFNVRNQAATIYVRRGDQWHAVAELCGMYDTPTMIDIVQRKWASKGHKIVMYPDASGKATHSTNASVSDIALISDAGFAIRAPKKNFDVRDRVQATNRAFSNGLLYVNSFACPTVARHFEQQAYDKNGDPDKKSGLDHQNDASTYPIVFEMPIRKPVFHIPITFAF